MNSVERKPYVIYMAEVIYSNISIIIKKNPKIQTKDAINKFIETDTFNKLSEGKLHNNWLNELKDNNYIDSETGNKIPQETLDLLEIQREATIKQLIKIPKLYEAKNNTMIEPSNRAYQFIWRMCESYELWCKESNQKELLPLNILD
tara:strand:- start:290 stop:730 length:441 start_codon:yes stop_codon:yes gene_type:complete